MLTSFIKILTMFIHQVTSPPSPHAMNIDDFQPPSHLLPNTPPPQQQQTMARGTKIYHPILNGKPANIALVCPCYPWLISFLGQPCDKDGNYLPLNTPPPPHGTATNDDWAPYEDEIQFRTANLLYQRVEMSQSDIDDLLELWALSLMKHKDLGPFNSYKHIYDTIDSTCLGDAPWRCFQAGLEEDLSEDAPSWKQHTYDVYYHDPDVVILNLLDNPNFDGEYDTTPYVELDAQGHQCWSDFMSANFPYQCCVGPQFLY